VNYILFRPIFNKLNITIKIDKIDKIDKIYKIDKIDKINNSPRTIRFIGK